MDVDSFQLLISSLHWRLAASWPVSLDTIFGGAQHIAKRVSELTGGRFQIRAYSGGEIVGGLQVLDAVSQGTVQMGHTASYYYIGKAPSLAFDTTLPFGFTARQQYAWQMEAGGNELLNKEVFASFNILTLPAGNTGCRPYRSDPVRERRKRSSPSARCHRAGAPRREAA